MSNPKKQYSYNAHTLAFEEIRVSSRKKLKLFLTFSMLVIFITGIVGYLLYYHVFAPEKYILSKKITQKESEFDRMTRTCDSLGSLLTGYYFPHDNLYRTILDIDTLPVSMRAAGSGGSSPVMAMYLSDDLSPIVKAKIKQLSGQSEIQLSSFDLLQQSAHEKAQKFMTIPAIQPIAQKDLIMVSSFFGKRFDPFCFEEKDHCGLDFVAPAGTKIYATGDGIVTLLNYSRIGYGNELVINHTFGYSTRYGHLEKFFVSLGDSVKRGQLIAALGNSGRSTGPHLHYEVLYEGKPVNPVLFYSNDLTDNEYHLLTNKIK